MGRMNLKDFAIAACLIGLAVFMVFNLLGFHSSVAGTIGPGIYPLVTLILIIVTGLIILLKSFAKLHFRLVCPFAAGSQQGLIVKKITDILSEHLGTTVGVIHATGQGFFSARYQGARAKPDGATLTVVSGDRPTPSIFHNARLHSTLFEPVSLLSFDPDVFVTKAPDSGDGPYGLPLSELKAAISGSSMGFSHRPETAKELQASFSRHAGVTPQAVFYPATQLMLESLASGQIAVGLCPLGDLIENKRLDHEYRIIAVGSPERLSEFPTIPTLLELGVPLVWGVWTGLALPLGATSETVDKFWKILSDPANRESLQSVIRQNRGVADIQGPEAFRRLLELQQPNGEETTQTVDDEMDPGKGSLYKVIAGIGFLLAFLLLAPHTGYLAFSLVFMFGLPLILWPNRRKKAFPVILTGAIGVSLSVYWIFTNIFSVVFP